MSDAPRPEEMPSTGNKLADIALRAILQELELAAEQMAQLRAEVKELRGSALRYRGVWSAVNSYGRGDLTTTGGSLYHCNVDGATEKPGTSSQWTLTAKSAER